MGWITRNFSFWSLFLQFLDTQWWLGNGDSLKKMATCWYLCQISGVWYLGGGFKCVFFHSNPYKKYPFWLIFWKELKPPTKSLVVIFFNEFLVVVFGSWSWHDFQACEGTTQIVGQRLLMVCLRRQLSRMILSFFLATDLIQPPRNLCFCVIPWTLGSFVEWWSYRTFFYSLSKMRWWLGSRGWCIRRMNREDTEKRRELLLLRLTRWCGDYWMECTRCVRQQDAAIYTPYLDFKCLEWAAIHVMKFVSFNEKILVISILDQWLIPVIWCLQFFFVCFRLVKPSPFSPN